MTSSPIVFLDTETTGLHADRRPWEIAMIRREGGLQSEITFQVTDVDLATAELIGLNIGRFYERHYQFKLFDPETVYASVANDDPLGPDGLITAYVGPEKLIAAEVERWTRGAHIVGAVPNFDTETLAAMLRRHGLCSSWHYHLIDVENLAVGFLNGAGRPAKAVVPEFVTEAVTLPWKSDDLSRACGVEPPSKNERHTAMGDARWAMRLYDRVTGAVEGEAL